MMGDTRNSTLNAKCADTNGLAELYGVLPAGELDAPDYTPKVAQGRFANDASKQQADGLGETGDEKAATLNAQA
jgi:hypothetical protein